MAKLRAKAEAEMAEREAAGAKARAEYEAFMASQGLPVQPAPTNIRDALQQVKSGFQELAESAFDDRRAILDPGADADLNHPPAEEEDEARRAEIARAERAAREAARRPFAAAAHAELAFTRIATTGRTQLEDVVRAL